jgi:Fe-S cluster assembly ATP-binding protein
MGHPTYTVTQGEIVIAGEDITALAPDKRAQRGMYLAMQYPPTLPGISVLTFLREAYQALNQPGIKPDIFTKQVQDALEAVGLPVAFAQRAVHDGFSGGEKKRLELAQILVLKPTTIILDEIDSGLDAAGIICVDTMINKIRAERPQTRFLCITHNPALAQALNPDCVHTMNSGTLV